MIDDKIEQVTLNIKRGDTKVYTITVTDDEGNLEDITGWTVFFTVKENIDDTDANAKISKTETTHSDPTNGESQITLTSTDTTLDPQSYVFDIQVKTDTSEIHTILEGILNISKDVTQRTS